MKKPFAELDPATIDEYIEQTEQQTPARPPVEDARYLRDLHYLHRKEEILQRAAQRLQLTSTADEEMGQTGRINEIGTVRSEKHSLPVQQRRPGSHQGFAWPKMVAVLAAILLLLGVLLGTSRFLGARSPQTPAHVGSTPAAAPTATASVPGTILFSDPLSQNIHDLPVDAQHFFKDDAYHIRNQSFGDGGVAIVQQKFAGPSLTYTLTMEEISGDDTSPTNAFGLMFNCNVNARRIETFYTFEILNTGTSSQYGFYRYDPSKSYPWTLLRQIKAGKEFHSGHGPKATNTVKVVAKGDLFTFYVNGVQVGSARNASLRPGSVGLLVNLKGTEVAFSNLLVTRP